MSTWVSLLQALLTPTIGVVAACVAWQQYRLAKQKHDIDIFNRRMQVYKATVAFIGKSESTHSISEDDYFKWINDVAEAEFLFGKEILDLLTDIETTCYEIITHERDNPMIKRNKKGEIVSLNFEAASLFGEVTSFRGRASLLFAPYFQTFLKLKSLQKESRYKELLKEEKEGTERYHQEHPLPLSAEDDIPF